MTPSTPTKLHQWTKLRKFSASSGAQQPTPICLPSVQEQVSHPTKRHVLKIVASIFPLGRHLSSHRESEDLPSELMERQLAMGSNFAFSQSTTVERHYQFMDDLIPRNTTTTPHSFKAPDLIPTTHLHGRFTSRLLHCRLPTINNRQRSRYQTPYGKNTTISAT
ncbi:hypothetical protein RB195_025343 [Necator americanus]|uniref:Uncharacterized protein n=1 Tax=Necator americanus TaxID=51031 RepID=A0ABR1ERW7_NECAM